MAGFLWWSLDARDAAAEVTCFPGPEEAAVEEGDLPGALSFDRIRPGDLPQSSVRAVTQDEQGFVWIGTEDGVARYDGHNMRVFRPGEGDPERLLGGWVNDVEAHPDGTVWVATSEGVSVYDPQRDAFTQLHPDEDDPDRGVGVNEISIQEEGDVWLARAAPGVGVVDPETLEVVTVAADTGSEFTTLTQDGENRLWLGTDIGLMVLDMETDEVEEFSAGEDYEVLDWSSISALKSDSMGNIWVGTEGDGAFVIDEGSQRVTRHYGAEMTEGQFLVDAHVTAILEDSQSGIWLGTYNGGLAHISGLEDIEWYQHDRAHPDSLPSQSIRSLYEDRGGVIWIGLEGAGVALTTELRKNFARYRTAVTTLALQEMRDGTYWAGTVAGGVYHIDPATGTERLFRTIGPEDQPESIDLRQEEVLAFGETRDAFWIGTARAGAIRCDAETGEMAWFHSGDYPDLASDWIFDFWEDDEGRLWLATWGGGLAIYDPASDSFSSFTSRNLPGLTSDHLYRLYPDPIETHLVWLATANGGLCGLNQQTDSVNCIQSNGDGTGLSGDNISSVHRAEDGAMWVATHGSGLNRLDLETEEAEHWRADDSILTTDTLYDILPDDEGRLWVSTNDGLYHVDPDEGPVVRYGVEDGLQADEFGLGASYRTNDGRLLMGGVEGFNVFEPGAIRPDDYEPNVVVTDFRSLGDEIPLDGPIWTDPTLQVNHTSSFEFEFAALSFDAPESHKYAYKLEGFDTDWIEDRRFARYARLGGGEYTLRVRAANRHGVWSDDEVQLSVHVSPAPWRTWWAYSLYGLVFAGAAVGYRHLHHRRLVRIEERNRLNDVERELELTGAVQHGFLPTRNQIETDRVNVFSFYRAADACGGDWWWYDQPSPGRHVILVGDVTGHGAGPAMVTAAVATAFRVQSELRDAPVQDNLEILNREVIAAGQGKYHMTLAALELDDATGAYTFYSAGSTPILLLQSGGVRSVPCRGTPLGTPDFVVGRVDGSLEPGARLLLYTDGIPEVPLENDRLLGIRRFARMFEQTKEQRLEDAARTIVDSADRLRGERTQDDDWTLVFIEWS